MLHILNCESSAINFNLKLPAHIESSAKQNMLHSTFNPLKARSSIFDEQRLDQIRTCGLYLMLAARNEVSCLNHRPHIQWGIVFLRHTPIPIPMKSCIQAKPVIIPQRIYVFKTNISFSCLPLSNKNTPKFRQQEAIIYSIQSIRKQFNFNDNALNRCCAS